MAYGGQSYGATAVQNVSHDSRGTYAATPGNPVYGLVYATVPELEAAVAAAPDDFPDGTPIYIETIDFDTPLQDDPISRDGWVIIYSHTPTPVTVPSVDHYEYWIDVYSPPPGTYSFVDPNDDGDGSIYVNENGIPVPTASVGIGGDCIGNFDNDVEHYPLYNQTDSSHAFVQDWEADNLPDASDIRP